MALQVEILGDFWREEGTDDSSKKRSFVYATRHRLVSNCSLTGESADTVWDRQMQPISSYSLTKTDKKRPPSVEAGWSENQQQISDEGEIRNDQPQH